MSNRFNNLRESRSSYRIVCYTAVFSVVTQRSSPEERCVTTPKRLCSRLLIAQISPHFLYELGTEGYEVIGANVLSLK